MAQPSDTPETPGTLMKTTTALLSKDSRSLLQIHQESKIPFYWLRNFSEQRYRNPSVNRVERLYNFLAGKELTL